ncbi:sigma-70 family RNA polymerase sigma factor [Streptomyces sp. A3M-1-3]|uniref:sigma-70 family RNA polymerase sigma factor n=1 Tax=Streptomyces sp. A3M-1-3 TaxID=2962044 RepID=UPI0020B76F9C|nr:sigma-70 family RNA polymerase sigma factor [Streptomyces sp. A3M-1-3]MCP3819671.1 sigma-70 family RNA polymerase sigma factor [Streptomyces sp. A3M-1-3]
MNSDRGAALVVAAQTGDQRAQDELVAAYLPLVYNIAGRALNGHADVDDVVQETMLRALDGLSALRAPESFRSWLVAITMNQIRRHWHARQSAPPSGGLHDAHDVADPGADFVDLTIVQLGLSGQRREAAEATRWLDPDDHALLSLWWLEAAGELTRAEVAAALELSPQHTAVRVQRMKAQLESARVVVRALSTVPLCAELRPVLTPWDGTPSALWRKRIARHARECAVCSGHWSGLVPAEGLLVGLALVPVAASLLHGVGGEAGAVGLAAEPVAAIGGPGRGQGRGTESRTDRRHRLRRRRRMIGAVAGIAVVAGAAGAFRLAAGAPQEDRSGPASASALTSAAPRTLTPSPTATASPSSSPSPTATPSKKPVKSTAPEKSSPRPTPARTTVRQQPAPPAGGGSSQSGPVQQVISLLNNERAKQGCGPVSSNAQLQSAAQSHSKDMAARDFFDHTNPDGAGPGERITAAGYRWSTYGENIARGQQSPAQVMNSWMNSPGHRANILNCAFKEVGIGIHDSSGGPWWTQKFGAR